MYIQDIAEDLKDTRRCEHHFMTADFENINVTGIDGAR